MRRQTRPIEYYRLWAGNSGHSGTWDIDAILEDRYEQSAHSAVCLSWARTPDEEIGWAV